MIFASWSVSPSSTSIIGVIVCSKSRSNALPSGPAAVARRGFHRLADAAQRLRERERVALTRGGQQVDQAEPLLQRQRPDHARVDEGEDAGVEADDDVAGMRVGVEEAVDQQHLDRGADGRVGDRHRVEAGGDDRLAVGRGDAVDELHRDHALRGQVPVDLRNVDAVDPVEVLCEAARVVRLDRVVELEQQRAAELRHHLLDADVARRARAPLHRVRRAAEDLQVRLDLVLDPRPLQLDHDVASVLEGRAMHLRERRGRERLRAEDTRTASPAARRAPTRRPRAPPRRRTA